MPKGNSNQGGDPFELKARLQSRDPLEGPCLAKPRLAVPGHALPRLAWPRRAVPRRAKELNYSKGAGG
jgi:hypothetical protein